MFGQFVALFEWLNTVVASFSILLFNSISRSQRLSSSSRANGCRIMNNFNLLVKYFDARWTGDILSSYLCFLQVDSKSEILAGRAKAIHVLLHFIRRVCGRAASWAQRKLRKRFSRILVLAFHLVRLKNLP